MALRAAGRYADSQIAFDHAESQLLWKSDEIASVDDLLAAGFTLVGNDLMVSYQGTIYDGVLVNTFKALNAMHGGDLARARVELNRADQRQENAVHQLAAKVAALGGADEDEEQYQEQVDRSMAEVMDPEGPVAARLQAVESLELVPRAAQPVHRLAAWRVPAGGRRSEPCLQPVPQRRCP